MNDIDSASLLFQFFAFTDKKAKNSHLLKQVEENRSCIIGRLFNSFTSFKVYAKKLYFDLVPKILLHLRTISIEVWLEYNYEESIRQVQIKGHLWNNWPGLSKTYVK